MTITITIADADAPEILQNFAATQGWHKLTDAEVSLKVAELCVSQLTAGAVQGSYRKQKVEQDEALDTKYKASISTAVA